jgi:SpoVK/Ycf46/Vps4 family AAA+-type ATPase
VLKDFGCYLQSRTFAYFDIVLAWLSEIRDVLAHTGRTVIFVGVDFEIPPALQHDITTIEFKLPNDAAIEKAVRYVGEDHPIDEAFMPALVTACRGMTQQQVEDRVALALRKFKKLNGEAARLILNEKAEVIRRTGLLDYRDPPVGGWTSSAAGKTSSGTFSSTSRASDPTPATSASSSPRPAAGRHLRRRQDADEPVHRQLPGPAADPARCRQPHVQVGRRVRTQHARGDPPARRPRLVRPATRRDRKGLRRCRRRDGRRICPAQSFGIFLKWLSDRSCPVYVVATANNIRALPVEFTRKGRFDELYGVYLPTHAERQDIFGIHLRLRKREPEQFDLDALARKTEGYTGADIKEVVQLGLKLAFHAGAELGNDHLLAAIPEIRPLSKTDPESVTEVTKWLDSHTKPAGNGHSPCSRSTATRSSGA